MRAGYTYPREPCPYCGDMISTSWLMWHIRTYHPLELKEGDRENPGPDDETPVTVTLTPKAQRYIQMIDQPNQPAHQTVEEALRIYTYLGDFIGLMTKLGILAPKI